MKIEKIFVASPGEKDNGGGESLHQLVDACNRLGYDAYIYYFDSKRNTVLEKMRIYNVKVATEIEDKKYNLLICPEMYTTPLKDYQHIRKGIWFLSLDFYLRSLPVYRTNFVLKKWKIPKIFFPIVFPAVLLKTNASFRTFRFDRDRVKYFLYNVEYARLYIENKCKYEHITRYLCGPINKIYFMDNNNLWQKEKVVAYNPKKSNGFTREIIAYMNLKNPDIDFVPIQNLNQNEVRELLGKASVYIDFGFFPGPERIPREAAIMRCNIITSRLGSAANDIDVPIDSKYKFDLTDDNIPIIATCIENMVNHYSDYVNNYEAYRRKVRAQKADFDGNVADFLESIENDKA